ncbi:MAG TPA: diiron oxygenase [Steroidobacteraceae bacterium]|jgi:hypothetical protein|nr:diiron oxygenase [Steroidobacteraceae bacterium]
MNAVIQLSDSERYARCARASKEARWDIEKDVIRGRRFEADGKYLPDALALPEEFATLDETEKRFVSRIQGRTYANVFGLVERFITAKLLEIGRDHSLGDQNALEALVRFSEEELRHQALFRRIDDMMAETMPSGYRFDIDPDDVARVVLANSTWAVLVLTLHIELFVQQHYRQSIASDGELSPLFKDVFLYHWKDECQHVVLDELELARHDATLTPAERDRGVTDFIVLVRAVDGILQMQAKSDAAYFAAHCGRAISDDEVASVTSQFLKAYRWQYILSGAAHPRFQKILGGLITEAQGARIGEAVAVLQ